MNKILLTSLCLLTALPLTSVRANTEEASGGRDPHAHSNGFTLTSGPYSMPASRQLVLADEHHFGSVIVDRLEYQPDNEFSEYELNAWYGTTWNRLLLSSEGEVEDGEFSSETDLLWQHALTAFWDTRLGIRLDQASEGENQQWLAAGISGLAPWWIESSAMLYLNDNGQLAFTLSGEHELLFTQRLLLNSQLELSGYGKDDQQQAQAAGLAQIRAGIRLRYDLSRHFGPYAGIDWKYSLGENADYLRQAGEPTDNAEFVVGLHFWF